MHGLKALLAAPDGQPSKAGWLLSIAALATFYYVAARLGLFLAFAATNATPVWPPSGIAFAALLLFGYRLWPGIAIGAFAANVVVFTTNGVASGTVVAAVSFVIAIGNTLEAIVGAYLFRHFSGAREQLALPNNIYKFALIAMLMSAISASIGTASLILARIAPISSQWTIAGTWWLGDFTGIMVLTPALLAWCLPVVPRWPARRVIERIVSLVALVLMIAAIFGQQFSSDAANRLLAYLLVPAIGWAAYRHGPRGVASVLLLMTGGAVLGTTSGLGPFAVGTLNDSLLTLEIYIALCSLIGLILTADLHERRRNPDARLAGRDILAHWLTLFCCLGLTILAWHFIATSTEQRTRDRFEYLASDIQQRIEERMQTYEQVLRSGKGLFNASQTVDRDEWYRFVVSLEIDLNYPGIQGFGFAKTVTHAEKNALEQEMRREGFAGFKVWPEGVREEYTPIIYLSPFSGRNPRAFGFDMFSEPVRRAAMEKARDSGSPSVTSKVVLVQDPEAQKQAGFLIYLPIYRNGASISTPEERRAALIGYVYSPFRMSDLMHGILGASLPEVALEIFDGIGETEQQRMYSSEPLLHGAQPDYPNSLMAKKTIAIEDRHWTLRITSLPAFEASVDRQKALIVLITGTIISLLFFSVVRAITATREKALALANEMTAALHESEVRFGSLVESASEFAIIATDLNGIIRIFSIGAERMLGYHAADMVGKQTLATFHLPEEVQARAAELSTETGRPVEGLAVFIHSARQGHAETREWTYVRKDDSRLPVQLTMSPIRGARGEITGYVGIARDITQERRTKEELRAAIQQAESASSAKSNFVANMSHELRTPMNAVLGIAYLMSNTGLSPEQKKYLDMIRASGQSLLNILNDILDFSKIEAGRMELSPAHFRLGDILNTLTMIMSVNAGEKDLELALGVDPDVPQWFVGDALRLQQVLVNLAGNAIKFTRRGEVAVLVELAERSTTDAVLRFRVRDTGIGMTDEQRSGLFSAFYQADSTTTRRFGGTGLGLAISSRLLAMMGGKIEVQSELGQGSEFIVTLPLQLAEGPTFLEAHEETRRDLRLLVVDDNATSRLCLGKAIATLNWQVDYAEGISQAFDCIRNTLASGQAYSAMLVDWKLPEMDGLAAIKAVRVAWPRMDTRIIVTTSAYGRSRLMEEDAMLQADAILVKPCTIAGMADAVREALSKQIKPEKTETRATPTAHRRLDGARLLLVEDNRTNQIVAKNILEQAGANVEVADDGIKAVGLLRAAPQRYDLVLMDVQMPVMDGYAATRLIRENLALDLPVLAMTAGVMDTERQQCIACGMNDFIAKPIDIEQMLSTIERYLSLGSATAALPAEQNPLLTTRAPIFDAAQLMPLTSGDPAYLGAIVDLLRKFIDKGTSDLITARKMWREDRAVDAAHALHTMRGSVGSIGAKRFAEVALALETAIHDCDTVRIEPLFDSAIRELDSAITAASQWISEYAPAAVPEQPCSVDAKDLERLEDLLSQQDVEAFDLYAGLRPALAERLPQHDLGILDRAIDRMDFMAAYHCLKRVAGENA